MSARRGSAIHAFRIASLVVPSGLAWHVAFSARHPSELTAAVALALGPLWLLTTGALAIRAVDALLQRRRAARGGATEDSPTLLDRVDVLSASGSAMAWTSALGIASSVWLGWASLAVVGLMGTGVLHLVVFWTCLRTAGEDPLRRASVARRFVPSSVVEGDPVIEELRLSGVRIPIGFRLFARGKIGPRWPTSRYAIDDAASGGEVVLERDLGPARRGEHEAPPLELWHQDVFGLCRTAEVHAAPAGLTVLPRPRALDAARPLLGEVGADLEPRPETRLPTEGTFKLREYQPGDDARRIHWVRSLVARELVVRLPDEVPPDRPQVDLVLDTFLPEANALDCDAPAELLDALVSVWLGVGRALVKAGVRVTLVTAARPEPGRRPEPARARWTRSTEAAALRLGARASWQETLPLSAIARNAAAIVVSCRLQPAWPGRAPVRWILVPEPTWTVFEDLAPVPVLLWLPHPMGSADNRPSRRRARRRRFDRALRDHGTFAGVCADLAPPRAGSFVARPAGPGRIRLEVLS